MPQGLDSCVSELIAVAIRIVTLVGVVCTVILIIFKSPFISLFVKDNLQVMNTSSEIITFYSFNFIFVGANIIINALYTAINILEHPRFWRFYDMSC
ncbi:Na+-driven multidrug efflux pump [Paenibacillus sp. PastF-3]|nr:Na+-driven multidrug efflux pump [Paenibacillus sp. PastF-3]